MWKIATRDRSILCVSVFCITECFNFLLIFTHFPIFFSLDVTHVFPEFPAPDLGNVLLQEGVTMNDVKTLQLLYRRHCEVITLNICNWLIDQSNDMGHNLCTSLSCCPQEKLNCNKTCLFYWVLQLRCCTWLFFSCCDLFCITLIIKTMHFLLFFL